MKLLMMGFFFLLLSGTTRKCNKDKTGSEQLAAGCYKGKLVVKAACMNYTVAVTGGRIDTSLVNALWTDEQSGKTYNNVFALGSKCNFPQEIKEGDEFYFTIDSTSVQNCAVCLIYYPVPSRHLSIKVLSQPCTP